MYQGYDACDIYPPGSGIDTNICGIVCCALANDADYGIEDWDKVVEYKLKRVFGG